MGQHLVIWNTPSHLHGLAKDPGLVILSVVALNNGNFEILLGAEKVALYVYITSTMQGTFDDNAFCMLAGSTKVSMSTCEHSLETIGDIYWFAYYISHGQGTIFRK
jgi:hypothetical protein